MTAIRDAMTALNQTFQLAPPMEFDGHVVFSIEGMGRLDVQEHGEELLVSLARDIATSDDRLAIQRAALQSVHYKHHLQLPTQASMYKNMLVFTVRLHADEVDVPAIDHALQQLHRLHEQARA